MQRLSEREWQAYTEKYKNRARMLISCPDRPGIVAAISHFLFQQGANIVQSDQYTTDPESGRFFMRIEFELSNLEERCEVIKAAFSPIAKNFEMEFSLVQASKRKKVAIFVSKEDHCLLELLWRWNSGELYADISVVISNHPDMRETVESFGIPYHCIPVTKENKPEAEIAQIAAAEGADLIVLARYMQILSPRFLEDYAMRIINIHHSFLPAFVGAKPYEQAYRRGVKLIGATAHYVTEELDAGPIIEQDVQRVTHQEDVETLKQLGRQVERTVLARAVGWHLEDRVLVYGNKTIVFP
ncbi:MULTISPECIES: formyltetrahydrofolate deformylase [Brevibacillus]|jgi:formyltetrahydrofolate deformylase|uniref:Formyltetrahydrofolate deformylase n=1 Tax=Brevibacillus centrosporus TaxID=54910 RepID=A0A1I4AD46_9BACL|nr:MULTISPECIES: formyltetrahydrofolate deformylase [Brevibacillus]MDR7315683.1 formyltetrahydrofolate deformylase [Brevibacillus nitrificans]MEC2128087.1 formyltetrahydrofolate deformylase [Brevibacillus centrosporus]MED1791828.1 formyltetrahydrofolate deformylase [Brevibacillus nitrificans]MED1952966.1 formyltetrahydrofolate deformylase [Brevibacillus centrosporus]MED4910610.1 formyltetrahydrofolate deformylase [Brevibacillus centrosporus]